MSLSATLSSIAAHPLARQHRAAALWRWARWQACKRLLPGPVAVPFVDEVRILLVPELSDACGNYYYGLHEFEDMAFALHFLRPGDLFADVGANVGSYTLLALAAGARAVCFEPVPRAFGALADNVNLNGAAARVQLHNAAVGAQPGSVRFTAGEDVRNRVLPQGAPYGGAVLTVPVVRLDDALRGAGVPALVKIDVEGYESEVLSGAASLLAEPGLQALLLELNGSGGAWGQDDDAIDARVRACGFTACRYEPLARRIVPLAARTARTGNVLYLRDPAMAARRTNNAPRFRIGEFTL